MQSRFDYRTFHYWQLLRTAIHISINEYHAANTGNEQKYEILFDTFLGTLTQPNINVLK
mgnify:CR=1 FL=1